MMYIVSVLVERERASAWRDWMRQDHIPQVLQTGCFVGATFARDVSADTATHEAHRTFYLAHDADALARYTREHGPALRADHEARFAGAAQASREVLEVLAAL